MFNLEPRRPGTAPPRAVLLDAALQQAARDAEDVPGAYSVAPWEFDPATSPVDALLDAFAGRDQTWMVVTCERGDADAHTRERALTAAQRYLLSLAAEGIDATWVSADALPEEVILAMEVSAGRDLLGVIHFDPA